MGDLPGRLRCCAGISPHGEVTRLRPEARKIMNSAAAEIDRLRAQLWSIGHAAGVETKDDLKAAALKALEESN